ncbi:MAG TPA: SRPBCC family protein [Mycobacterium sp.]|nr:SRPBCC family protein [Mycobacterium sp.]
MAVRASREVVIEAPPETILNALADIESAPSWSPMHKRVEVLDTYDDGRPHHVKVHYRLMGIADKEVLEYHWGRDWMVWDAAETFQQHAQHVEYTLRPEGGKTRVRFDLTMELRAPVPDFLMRRATNTVLDIATEGLRRRVLGVEPCDGAMTKQRNSFRSTARRVRAQG